MQRDFVETSLADVCNLVTDGTHDTPKRVQSGFPLIKAKEIVGGQIDFSSCDQISETDHRKVIARSKPEFGDTLFTHIGASLGAAAFVNTNREFSIKNIALFKPNPTIIDSRYLYYLVISPDFQSLAIGTKTGSAQPFLGLSQLRSHRIRYHRDLPIQRRIAGILSAYDELIENSQRRIKILETMARALYREWFVHFRFPGHENVPLVPSSMGPIPQGWEVRKLGEIYNTTSGGTPSRKRPEYFDDGCINWVKSQELLDAFILGTEERITHEALENSSAKIIPPNTVLIALYGATIGMLAILAVEAASNQACCAVLPISAAYGREFAFLTLLTNRNRIIGLRLGAAQQNISQVLLRNFECVKPPPTVALEFAKRTAPLFDGILNLQRQTQNLRRTRDLLLPRLLSGQIDVESLDRA
jgi:type I restriction enzyme S subunit